MEEWKEIKVGDIGRVITGKTPKTWQMKHIVDSMA